ncbi:MAG TPA: hypothetical protein VEF04_11575 [Blastocatellia bacterium]|nr:hypothetical protein [Blastocatellia bacterium]
MLSATEPKDAGELLSAIRVESVMARLPLHVLTKGESVKIHLEKHTGVGDLSLLWEVSPSSKYGVPRMLAYKIDTLIINRRVDECGHPIPQVLKLGSLRSICREMEIDVGGSGASAVKAALAQNAGATITAKLSYRDRSGKQRRLEAVFNRYSVVFTGESLPDGNEADGIYIVFNEIYRNFLNQVPFRPLDFNYLKQLAPSVQRFYEIISFRIYAALTSGQTRASLAYSEYCDASTQQRYFDRTRMSKQMHKVHRPHIQSGYLAEVSYEESRDDKGNIDWIMWYKPGPKARMEYRQFSAARVIDEHALSGPQAQLLPLPPTEADQLAAYFVTSRFGQMKRSITVKEKQAATRLVTEFGLEASKEAIDKALEIASEVGTPPRWLTGLEDSIRSIANGRLNKSGPSKTKFFEI